MITTYTITLRDDNGEFTATLIPDYGSADELFGTGETVSEALHDLADQCEEVAV